MANLANMKALQAMQAGGGAGGINIAALQGMNGAGAGRGGGAGGLAALGGMGGKLGAAMSMAAEAQQMNSVNNIPDIIKAFEKGNSLVVTKLASFPEQEYMNALPEICSFLCRFDPRVRSKKGVLGDNDLTMFLMKYTQIFAQNRTLALTKLNNVLAVLEWWAQILHESNGEAPGVPNAANSIMGQFSGAIYQDGSLGIKMLPTAMKCLISKNDKVIQSASGMVTMVSMNNKEAVAEHISTLLQVLEAGIPDMAACSLFSSLYNVYEKNRDEVHRYVDTIVEYAVTGPMSRATAINIVGKIAKRAPRLLYGFVDQLVPLMSDQRSAYMSLQSLSDIAARNALVVRPYVRQIQQTAEELSTGGYFLGAVVLGRIGRVDPLTAQQCQDILVNWLRSDVDPQNTGSILSEVRNIGGVYKTTLTIHIDTIRNFLSYPDMKVTDIAKLIIDYYDGKQAYLADSFLWNQEDIYGRIIKVVDAMVDSKVSSVKKSVEELSARADHQEAVLNSQAEELTVVSSGVTMIGDRVNAVEAAARQLENRVDKVEASVQDLQKSLTQRDGEIKSFLATVVKKLPVPYAYEGKGIVRKRVILKFKCAKGSEPDFTIESAAWTKWIRVAVCAFQAGNSILVGDAFGTLGSLYELFNAMRKKDLDADLTFQTLCEEPFLTSKEEDELIEGLREKGFFKLFAYDPLTATWARKSALEEDEGSASSGSQNKPPPAPSSPAPGAPPAAVASPSIIPVGASASITPMTVTHSSWMVKKGQGFMASDKRRWFILERGVVSYYETATKEGKKGEFPVASIVSISPQNSSGWFVIQTPGYHSGKFEVLPDDAAVYQAWVKVLKDAGAKI